MGSDQRIVPGGSIGGIVKLPQLSIKNNVGCIRQGADRRVCFVPLINPDNHGAESLLLLGILQIYLRLVEPILIDSIAVRGYKFIHASGKRQS